MTHKIMRALAKLSESMSQNLPHVKQKLSRAGASSTNALVFSVATYYTALNKLAEEE